MSSKRKILWIMTIALLLGGCQNVNIGNQSKEEQEEATQAVSWSEMYDTDDTGVLVGIDEKEQNITVKKIDSGEKITLSYTGGTSVTDKYESVLVMEQVAVGELVNIYYSQKDSTARKVEVVPEAWEYTNVVNLSFDQTQKTIDIAGDKYRYGDSFTIVSGKDEIRLLDLNPIDVVTVKGINKKICSIIVTRGHGYLSLENGETFIDGWIEISQESARPITKDMLVVASEGNHKVTVAKDKAGGTKSVTIKRNEKVVLDVGDLKSETPKSGSLKFTIKPSGATLYIDGVKKEYSELVLVDYGAHIITVKSDGNTDYSQTIVVGSNYAEIEINAGESSSSKNTANSSNNTNTTTNTNNTSNNNTSPNTSNNTGTNTPTVKSTENNTDSNNSNHSTTKSDTNKSDTSKSDTNKRDTNKSDSNKETSNTQEVIGKTVSSTLADTLKELLTDE